MGILAIGRRPRCCYASYIMYRLEISEELRQIMLEGERHKFPKGHILQSTNDNSSFNFIVSGYIKRYLIRNDGSLGTQVIYGPNDLFPITLAFSVIFERAISESTEIYYYEAITPVTTYSLNKDAFKDQIEQNSALYKGLLAISGKRLHSTLHGLENLTLSNAYHRIAHELLYMAQRFGETLPNGSTKICIPLTHQDLADILSLTRETVSINMVELRKKKLISTGKSIVVTDIKSLEQEAFN